MSIYCDFLRSFQDPNKYWPTSIKRYTDLVLRWNFGLSPNLHKFLKWRQEFSLSSVSDKNSLLVRWSDQRSSLRPNLIGAVQSHRQLHPAKLQAFSSNLWRFPWKKSLHLLKNDLRILDRFLDHFFDRFVSELRSNLTLCCSANLSGLRNVWSFNWSHSWSSVSVAQ